MTALFQPEISTIDSQLAALQAQIAAIQEQRVALNKAEAVAENIVQAVRGGVEEFQQIAGISGDAIARLKSAVLDIFQSGDGDDDGGNNPNPAPQPSDDGGCGVVSAQMTETSVDAIAVASEVTEVSPEVPQPEPQSEPEQLASDFQKEVQARGIQTICSSDGTPKFDLIWTRLSDRVATYSSPENPYNWEHGFVSYLGFAVKEVAESWQQHLLKTGAASKCIIRKVNRLKVDCPKGVRIRWEMKCHGLSENHLQNILASGLTQVPVCYLPEPEVLAALAKFHAGSRVKVVKPWANGDTRDMGRLGTVNRIIVRDGLVAVDLDDCSVQRDYTPDTIAHLEIQDLVPVVVDDSAEVRDISTTDWQAEAKEVGVRIDYSAPGQYIAYHKYRKLGEVVEKHDADSPYYVNRNQRTMLNVGNGDGLKYSDPYEAAIGLAKFLKVIVEPEVAKADLNSSYNEPFPAPQALQTWREIEIEQQKQIDVAPKEQQIEANDWVELLVNGDRYQVGEVDAEGVHLNTNDGTMLVQPNEIQLLMKIPSDWQPFQAPTNWQPF